MAYKVFISDKMSEDGLNYFRNIADFEVTYNPEITMEDLGKTICDYDALVIRSRTKVSAEMLSHPGKLRAIGRAGAGVDNVDCAAATAKGVVVMNTPGGNTVSTAEHAMSMMLSLARRIPYADRTMHEGKWAKKNIVGIEMDGKTLGILGLGKIGQVVASRMQAFGMNLMGFDPFLSQEAADKLGVELADVDTICQKADVITIHAPLNDATRGMIGKAQFGMMKPTMLLINCARGGIVDEDALLEALQNNTIAGAAFDVFTSEPLPEDHPLRSLDNMVMTPHLAASTNEAQERVAMQIADQIQDLLVKDITRNAVNAPSVDSKTFAQMRPVFGLCERLGNFAGQYVPKPLKSMSITYSGTMGKYSLSPMTSTLLKGFLSTRVEQAVNAVNAMVIAKERGFAISETRDDDAGEFAGLITVELVDEKGDKIVFSGTLNHLKQPRLAEVAGCSVDVYPNGGMLVVRNRDVPGIIGKVGVCLGDYKINIAELSWGRDQPGGVALTVINTDEAVPAEVITELKKVEEILEVTPMLI